MTWFDLLVRTDHHPFVIEHMEYVRRVLDEEALKVNTGSISTAREDAHMFRARESYSLPCESIIELYELLWRWGHSGVEKRGFAARFGFSIPDTVVILKGKPYAWYFMSKKDGSLLRKTGEKLNLGHIEKTLVRDREETQPFEIMCTWLPMASQFADARCHCCNAEFFTKAGATYFLGSLRPTHSGVFQVFVRPHGISNFLIRTVHFLDQTSVCVRTNRSLLNGRGDCFVRSATFEGWAGLSSTNSRYKCHKHPQMEEVIISASERFSDRIHEERVRQMLFLPPDQHIALHFKVAKDHELFFMYGSVISEKEAIQQTRPQLLMGDPAMTDELVGSALLRGGTEKKALPYSMHQFEKTRLDALSPSTCKGEEAAEFGDRQCIARSVVKCGAGGVSLPPINDSRGVAKETCPPLFGDRSRRRGQADFSAIPRVSYPRPEIPQAPFTIQLKTHFLDEVGRFECLPPCLYIDKIKQPLIVPTSDRSEKERTKQLAIHTRTAERPSSASSYHTESTINKPSELEAIAAR